MNLMLNAIETLKDVGGEVDRESQLHAPIRHPDEDSFASAHCPLLVYPETLAQSPLQHLARSAHRQIRF